MIICPICGSKDIKELKPNYYCCLNCKEWFGVEPAIITQEDLSWDIVEEQIQKNTQDRFDWRTYLGMSLTRAIARLKNEGLDAKQVYKELCSTHPDLSEELKKRLRIGISARFGEMNVAQSELNKGGTS